jgi:WD40 repeat protein
MNRRIIAFGCCLALIGAFFLLAPGYRASRTKAEWKERATFTANHCGVFSVAVAPDGRIAAAALTDGTVHLWDLSTLVETASLKGHTLPLCAVAFTPDGRGLLSAGGGDGMLKIWELKGDK